MASVTQDAYCPRCGGKDFVKNGRVRNMQRFRCRSCSLNFVDEPKHRWPPSSKLINIMFARAGEGPETALEIARVDRWILEAKEHHPWFIRALAEFAVNNASRRGETLESLLIRTWELYAHITERHPEPFYDVLAPDLYLDMFIIGDEPFRNELRDWLAAHSSHSNFAG
ncbi:IS1 family transposase [Rhizobium wenxiniae]|uniref:IS1 family transposase n=1 Tax=Rhizobium wenxiniae TaxID=1737357 RepID=UPI00161C4C98